MNREDGPQWVFDVAGRDVRGRCEHPDTNPMNREDRANRAAAAPTDGCRQQFSFWRGDVALPSWPGLNRPSTNHRRGADGRVIPGSSARGQGPGHDGERLPGSAKMRIGGLPRPDLSASCQWPACRWRTRASGLHPMNREDRANRAAAAPAGGCLGARCWFMRRLPPIARAAYAEMEPPARANAVAVTGGTPLTLVASRLDLSRVGEVKNGRGGLSCTAIPCDYLAPRSHPPSPATPPPATQDLT